MHFFRRRRRGKKTGVGGVRRRRASLPSWSNNYARYLGLQSTNTKQILPSDYYQATVTNSNSCLVIVTTYSCSESSLFVTLQPEPYNFSKFQKSHVIFETSNASHKTMKCAQHFIVTIVSQSHTVYTLTTSNSMSQLSEAPITTSITIGRQDQKFSRKIKREMSLKSNCKLTNFAKLCFILFTSKNIKMC